MAAILYVSCEIAKSVNDEAAAGSYGPFWTICENDNPNLTGF